MNALSTLLGSAASLRVPERWTASLPRIREERQLAERLLNAVPPRKIYGFNTMSGHREGDSLTERQMSLINSEILSSHCIGDDRYFEPFAARCIGFARLYALAAGGSGVTEGLYTKLIDVVTTPAFQPKVPRCASYSSGDVIVCAHWLQDALTHLGMEATDLQAGEVMALINGCSAQVGAAAAFIPALEELWCAFGDSSEMFYSFSGIRRDSLQTIDGTRQGQIADALALMTQRLNAHEMAGASCLQESVSIRAFPQFLETLHTAIADYMSELDTLILAKSCNPLFQMRDPHYISQASFLAPILTNRMSSIIDAVLFALAGVVGRLAFLLSGSVPGINVDGAAAHDLGIIQVPKLLTAELDAIRLSCGTRWSISHIATSYGVEDVASYGLIEIERLKNVVAGALDIVRGEMAALTLLSDHQAKRRSGAMHTEPSRAQQFVALRRKLKTVDFAKRGSWLQRFFPGDLGNWRGDAVLQ